MVSDLAGLIQTVDKSCWANCQLFFMQYNRASWTLRPPVRHLDPGLGLSISVNNIEGKISPVDKQPTNRNFLKVDKIQRQTVVYNTSLVLGLLIFQFNVRCVL